MRLDAKHWTVPKNKKKQIFWSHEGFQPEFAPGLPPVRHMLKSTQIFGFVDSSTNLKQQTSLFEQLHKYINFQYNTNEKPVQIHSIYNGFAT